MVRVIFILTMVFTILKTTSMSAQKNMLKDSREELVNWVEQTYAQGALNKLDIDQLKKGFHPQFNILIPKGDNVFKLSLDKWLEIIQDYKDSSSKVSSGVRNLEYKIQVLDITQSIASVKVEFFKNEQLVITDYISFIRFEQVWMAVSKVSKEHIKNPLNLDL